MMSAARWQALWLGHSQRRGWLAQALRPLALLYGGLTALRRGLYACGLFKSHRLNVPVIVVGNVVVGGAGKTPTVIAVVNHLRAQGWHPGVVSRGHGRHGDAVVEVQPDTPPADSGDEPALIRLRTGVPVCVSKRRVDAARALLRAHPEVDIVVCDDGLQHLALQRDLHIVVFDDRGTGNGWLLPAGLLREPWPRTTTKALPVELLLHQHREDADAVPPIPHSPGAALFSAKRRLALHACGPNGARLPLDSLRGQRLTAVAGIARPAVFFDMLRAAGLQVLTQIALPDHAAASHYALLLQDAGSTIICTEKDAVKLFPMASEWHLNQAPDIWAVPLELIPDPDFFEVLDHHLEAMTQRL